MRSWTNGVLAAVAVAGVGLLTSRGGRSHCGPCLAGLCPKPTATPEAVPTAADLSPVDVADVRSAVGPTPPAAADTPVPFDGVVPASHAEPADPAGTIEVAPPPRLVPKPASPGDKF